jgi:hypothetical protein
LKDVCAALNKFRFRGLGGGGASATASGTPITARGWSSAHNFLDTDMAEDKVLVGRMVVFALRREQRRIPKELLAARIGMEERAEKEVLGVEKLQYERRREIRLRVREELAAQTQPTSHVTPVIWDQRAGRLRLCNTSERVNADFVELFERTFDRKPVPLLPTELAVVVTGDESAGQRLDPVNLVPEPAGMAVAGRGER